MISNISFNSWQNFKEKIEAENWTEMLIYIYMLTFSQAVTHLTN